MAARLAARDLDALGVLSPPPTSALTVSPVRPVEAAIVRAITSWPASGHSRTGISTIMRHRVTAHSPSTHRADSAIR